MMWKTPLAASTVFSGSGLMLLPGHSLQRKNPLLHFLKPRVWIFLPVHNTVYICGTEIMMKDFSECVFSMSVECSSRRKIFLMFSHSSVVQQHARNVT